MKNSYMALGRIDDFRSLIYFFISCILRAYYMPFTLLGSGDTLVSTHYRKTVTQTETTPPPNSCEILPPSGFSRSLNILWNKNNFILHVNILRTTENHWYHKPTLEVKYTIRMRTLNCRLLNGYSLLFFWWMERHTRVWSQGSSVLIQWVEPLILQLLTW